MASNFKYLDITDFGQYFNRMGDFDSKFQIFPTATSGNIHLFRNSGVVEKLFVNGEEIADHQSSSGDVDSNGDWYYTSGTNQVEYYNSNYTSTTINEQVFEAGEDFYNFVQQILVNASLELHNYLDARYSTPLEKSKQVDIDTTPVSISEEYDTIIIKATAYIAAANMIRAKEGVSEEADYYMNLVTNAERTGIVDKLNDGIYKLSNEIDANDKKGKILARTTSGTMDIVELSGEYSGENYDLLKVEIETTGVYGVGEFKVSYLSNDKLEGATTSAEKITGGLQHIFGGLSGRFQGASATDGDVWYIEVYGSHVKQTNKSNATIEMVR